MLKLLFKGGGGRGGHINIKLSYGSASLRGNCWAPSAHQGCCFFLLRFMKRTRLLALKKISSSRGGGMFLVKFFLNCNLLAAPTNELARVCALERLPDAGPALERFRAQAAHLRYLPLECPRSPSPGNSQTQTGPLYCGDFASSSRDRDSQDPRCGCAKR